MSDDVRGERLKKLALLKEAGMDAYPVESKQTLTISQFLESFDEHIENKKPEVLVGRVISIRGQGGILFADIDDGTARVQFVLEKAELGEPFTLFGVAVDQGDFIECEGVAYLTKRGEKSLKASSWRMLSKSLLAIPTEWYGIKDPELKLRERYLDLLLDPELRGLFVRRAKFWSAIREFLHARAFLEVETPALETSPGGADARPFITRHNSLDMEVYLRISLELWQKRLLIAGFPKVFEIGRIFRNEGQSREHLQDYAQLETYEAYSDMRKGMEFVRELYRHIVKQVYGKSSFTINGHEVDFEQEWKQVNFSQLIKEHFGLDPITEIYEKTGKKVTLADLKYICEKAGIKYEHAEFNIARTVDNLWKQVRKSINGPAFLVGVPVFLEPLAKRTPDNPQVVERFQVLIAGSEVGKGFSELNDPQDQRVRFEEQQKLREGGDDEAQRLDEEYVHAMEYGMPPAFGFGVSERLFAFLENKPAHEAQLFPLLRPKQ